MDEVVIIIDGKALTGWEEVHVVRGCERVPSAFDVAATERYPGQYGEVWIEAGAPCQVTIGGTVVLTGYVDRVSRSLSPHGHTVRVQGRSKIEDIIDCSVTGDVIKGMQVTVANLMKLATAICTPYKISVRSLTGDDIPITAPGMNAVPFSANIGQTGYELIEEVARYAQVLAYDNEMGDLILARAGAGGMMASGFAEGVNVQHASCTLTMDQRFREYVPHLMSTNVFGNQGIATQQLHKVLDTSVPRFRQLAVISEQTQFATFLANQRAQWEKARRYGRSQAIRLVCDSWRDGAGTLWQPNAKAEVALPSIKCHPTDPWVISEVTYSRDAAQGTTAELLLMPIEAFTQEPIFLFPFAVGIDSNSSPGTSP